MDDHSGHPFCLSAFDRARCEASAEYQSATKKFGRFHNRHEGYAVLLEEVEELWAAIKAGSAACTIRAEARQVAAMALRFMVDCCEEEGR